MILTHLSNTIKKLAKKLEVANFERQKVDEDQIFDV